MVLVKAKKLSFWERLFFWPLVKGLWTTFSQIFHKKVTRLYPEERLKSFPEMKGHPVLVKRPDGKPRCVACGLCEFACPPRAIYIEGHEIDDDIERAPEIFEIDNLRCIQCGFCEESCPKEAIVISHRVEFADVTRESLIYDLETLLVDEHEVQDRLDYIRKSFERWKT